MPDPPAPMTTASDTYLAIYAVVSRIPEEGDKKVRG
jgi:hypothetical protein